MPKKALRLVPSDDGTSASTEAQPKPQCTIAGDAPVFVTTNSGEKIPVPFALLPHVNTVRRLLANPEGQINSRSVQEALSALFGEAETFGNDVRGNLQRLFQKTS